MPGAEPACGLWVGDPSLPWGVLGTYGGTRGIHGLGTTVPYSPLGGGRGGLSAQPRFPCTHGTSRSLVGERRPWQWCPRVCDMARLTPHGKLEWSGSRKERYS